MSRAAIVAAATLLLTVVGGAGGVAQESDNGCLTEGVGLSIAAENNAFDRDCLQAAPDEPVELTLENRDRFSHNLSIYTERGGDALFTGEYVPGDTTTTYEVPALAGGSYLFICDIHPQMEGTFLVAAPGEMPSASPGSTTDDARAPQGPTVELELVARGFAAPVFITSARRQRQPLRR